MLLILAYKHHILSFPLEQFSSCSLSYTLEPLDLRLEYKCVSHLAGESLKTDFPGMDIWAVCSWQHLVVIKNVRTSQSANLPYIRKIVGILFHRVLLLSLILTLTLSIYDIVFPILDTEVIQVKLFK